MKLLSKLMAMMMVLSVLFLSSCGDDDEQDPTTQMLIGVWQSTEILLETATVDGTSIIQYYIDELGYTQEEAEAEIELFLQILSLGYSGTIEFKNDNTYTASFGGDVETGTWLVLEGGSSLQITESGTSETTVLEIRSVGSTLLVIGIQETEDGDLNDDGSDEEIILEIQLTLEKAA